MSIAINVSCNVNGCKMLSNALCLLYLIVLDIYFYCYLTLINIILPAWKFPTMVKIIIIYKSIVWDFKYFVKYLLFKLSWDTYLKKKQNIHWSAKQFDVTTYFALKCELWSLYLFWKCSFTYLINFLMKKYSHQNWYF